MSEASLGIVMRAEDQATQALTKMQSALDGVAKHTNALTPASNNANTNISKLNSTLGSVKSTADKAKGGLGGLVDVLGKMGLAGMGISSLIGAARGLGDALGIGLNVEMENTRAQLMAFTKDGAKAESILADIRKEADKTPFAFSEMAKATAGLMSSAKMASEPLMQLVKDAEILAASNPAQGLEGAAFALREAVSGDFTSIIERFNLPRSYINKLKEEGVPALEIVRRAMKEMGYDTDLVSNLANTASGRWSTFMDTIDSIKVTISGVVFDKLKDALSGMQGWFDANKDTIDGWATAVGDMLGRALSGAIDLFGRLAAAISPLIGEIGVYTTAIWAAIQGQESFGAILGPIGDIIDAVASEVGFYSTALLAAIRGEETFGAVLGDMGDVLDGLVGLFQGAEGAGLDLHNALERMVGLEVANFFIGIVSAVQSLTSKVPSLDEVLGRLHGVMSDLGPTGDRLSRLFDAIRGAINALIPSPVLDLVSGLGEMAGEANNNIDVLDVLVATVNAVSAAIESGTRFISDHKEVQALLVGVLGSLTTAWAAMTVVALAHSAVVAAQTLATTGLTAAQTALNVAMSANPIGLIVIALAALVAALVYTYQTSEDFRRIVDRALQAVSQSFQGLMDAALPVLTWLNETFSEGFLTGLMNLGINASQAAIRIGQDIVEGIRSGIASLWDGFLSWVREQIDKIPEAVRKVLGISSPSREFFKIGENIMDGLIAGVKSRNTSWADAMRGAIGESIKLVEGLVNRIEGGMSASVIGRGASAVETIRKALEASVAAGGNVIQLLPAMTFLTGVGGQLTAADEGLQMLAQIKDVVAGMQEMGMAINEDVIAQFRRIGGELGGPFQQQLERFIGSLADQDVMRELRKTLAEVDLGRQIASTASVLESLGQTMPESLRGLLQRVPREAGGILDTIITQILSGAIPGFASGGIVPGPVGVPRLAMVHGGEAIIPVGRAMPRGGDTYVTVRVSGSVISERDLGRVVREELLRVGRRTVTGGILA